MKSKETPEQRLLRKLKVGNDMEETDEFMCIGKHILIVKEEKE